MAVTASSTAPAPLLYRPAGGGAFPLRGMAGGGLQGDVVAPLGLGKHVDNVKPAPLTLACELPLDKPFQDMLAFSQLDINAVLTAVGAAGEAMYHLDLLNAAVSGVRFPRCDAAAPRPGRMSITLQSLSGGYRRKVGELAPKPSHSVLRPNWLTNQFRLEIKGLDCSRVLSIEEIVVSRSLILPQGGDGFTLGPEAQGHFTVRVPLSHCGGWLEWQDSRLVRAGLDEKSATLSLLAGDMATVLGKVTLGGLGLFSLKLDPVIEANSAPVSLTASMYVESVRFDLLRK